MAPDRRKPRGAPTDSGAPVATESDNHTVEVRVATLLRQRPELGYRDVDELALALLRRWALEHGIDDS